MHRSKRFARLTWLGLSIILLSGCDNIPQIVGPVCVSSRGVTYKTPPPALFAYLGPSWSWSCDKVQAAEDAAVMAIEKHADRVSTKRLRGYVVEYLDERAFLNGAGKSVAAETYCFGKYIRITMRPICDGVLTHEFLHAVSDCDSFFLCGEHHCDWESRGFYAAISNSTQCL
jgi:hypothetical protein